MGSVGGIGQRGRPPKKWTAWQHHRVDWTDTVRRCLAVVYKTVLHGARLCLLSLSNPALNLTFSLLPITSSHPHASASDSTFDYWRYINNWLTLTLTLAPTVAIGTIKEDEEKYDIRVVSSSRLIDYWASLCMQVYRPIRTLFLLRYYRHTQWARETCRKTVSAEASAAGWAAKFRAITFKLALSS